MIAIRHLASRVRCLGEVGYLAFRARSGVSTLSNAAVVTPKLRDIPFTHCLARHAE